MEPAGATADFESQPGVLLTAIESQPDLFASIEEPSQAQPASNGPTGSTRPRRGDKTPASFADYAVIEPVRSQKKKRGRSPKTRVAEVQPTQQQEEEEEEEEEEDDLPAALAIPGLPALPDLGGAVREFMLGEGPKLSMEGIKHLSDQAVLNLLAKIPAAFLVNLDADPQQLVNANLLDIGVYSQYKHLALPLQRYLIDRVCAEWFGKLLFTTKSNYFECDSQSHRGSPACSDHGSGAPV
ncbi:hypothetical protein NADE_008004 [Nannochloris sp. 'desiccata']|nr:hypothetical protein KSW81_006144 [Chlorella desiccata (nom. nud.)]KAH7619716.1 hypothetical protein NADE_008004 [Chlorella desiccata (nom. nud.)]